MELICAKIIRALEGPNICDFLIDWLIAMLDWLAPFYDMHTIILRSFTNLCFLISNQLILHSFFTSFVCLIIDYTLRAIDIIILDACLAIVFVWGMDVLIILIDPLVYSHILIFLALWLLCSPWHVDSCCCLSRSSWHDWFSWLYISMIIMEHAILARYSSRLSYFFLSLCVDLDDIHVLCMTVCCMTSLFVWLHELLIYVRHTPILLSPSP